MVALLHSARHQGINFLFQFGVASPVLFLPPEIFLLPPGSAVPQGHQSVFMVRFFCARTSQGVDQDFCSVPILSLG
jgi:hypothetical protein